MYDLHADGRSERLAHAEVGTSSRSEYGCADDIEDPALRTASRGSHARWPHETEVYPTLVGFGPYDGYLLFLPRLGSVVALQIRDDGLCRGFWDRRAECADHLVHQPLPRGTREWGLHRDIRRAVTDTAEALHKLSSLSVGERGLSVGHDGSCLEVLHQLIEAELERSLDVALQAEPPTCSSRRRSE